MFSVIIPTMNRWVNLQRALEAYLGQTALGEISEILVSDDGSTDKTPFVVSQIANASPVPIRYFRQQHRGAGSARNLAIREARGDLLLFTDDDVIPSPTLVEEHSKWHRQNPDPCVAILGFIPWDPEVHPTPFMNWLISEGPVLNLRECSKRKELGFGFFCTGNLSLKAEFLRKNGTFDEDFRTFGYEDLELGYRLTRRGLRILYNPDAVGYHYKHMSFADACRRKQLAVAAEKVFQTKEAGVYFGEIVARRRSTLKYRILKLLARWVTPVLTPLRPLLDTQIPLPWFVYRALYHYYSVPKVKAPEAVNRNSEKG